MSKKASLPLCVRCGEDARDMVEKTEHKRYTEYFCSVCGLAWVVSKPLND